jgi:potassium-transporting ATPase KdpC subunit
MWKQMLPGLRMTLWLTLLTGLFYPGIVTGLCQALFPRQANGSLISHNGRLIGSELIGQAFTRPEYFQPRPSAAGAEGYDASASSGSNLGPTSQKLMDRVKAGVDKLHTDNPTHQGAWPADMATTSASGLDPHISPESAIAQVARVASARHSTEQAIRTLVDDVTEGRDLGLFGEPRVNVLKLNLALDQRMPIPQ